MHFILHHMHPQINTIPSNPNHLTISKYLLQIKNNLQKIPQHLQNIHYLSKNI
ncbi:endoribonuclease YicC domain-containing protein [Bacillus mycoides]|uniref:endoribonuclease YicC domain-containing protein n=1 Tax=Bacillus mycoides TaxID=1405 RepID=UPI0011A789B5